MIITRISGGLGNQMFQYAIARSLAQRNNTVFKLDLSFYQKQILRKYELDLLKIKENIANEEECSKLRGKEGLLYKVLKKFKIGYPRPAFYVEEKHVTLFKKEIFELEDDIYLSGFWQNEKYFLDIKKELVNDFIPKHNINDVVKDYLEKINNSNSVSLHVRRGDYVENSNTKAVHGICDINYYKKAIEEINSNVESPVYFIFSDDIPWCKENFGFLEDKVFVDNTKSGIDDLFLMKHCHHNVIANSTFSWWGAWLNENIDKIVISPTIWFQSNHRLHLAPKEWIKL